MADKFLCSIPDCGKPVQARGWCNRHYKRWKAHGDPTVTVNPPNGTVPKWIREVALCHEGDECLIWPFSRNTDGYGQLNDEGRTTSAHRFICRAVHGEPSSSGLEAAHSCGNGHLGCVNPAHLRWATRVENIHDCIDHETFIRGERNSLSKIKGEDISTMRQMRETGMTLKDIGAQFNVSGVHVGRLLSGKRWTWFRVDAA